MKKYGVTVRRIDGITLDKRTLIEWCYLAIRDVTRWMADNGVYVPTLYLFDEDGMSLFVGGATDSLEDLKIYLANLMKEFENPVGFVFAFEGQNNNIAVCAGKYGQDITYLIPYVEVEGEKFWGVPQLTEDFVAEVVEPVKIRLTPPSP